MKKIAIFGGSGFIGQALAKELLRRQNSICIFDIRKAQNLEGCSFFNINNLANEELRLRLNEFEVIIDLAYSTNPKTSFKDPIADINKNLPETVRRLTLATKLDNLENYIYVSSGGTVYGNTKMDLIDENHRTNPISPYGITKLSIEKYGLMYNSLSSLPITIVRPSNAYGRNQRINSGQGFITYCINEILNDRPVNIFGDKGTVRDYIYISDIANAIAEISAVKGDGNIYNVGTGIGLSNLDIVEHLRPLATNIGKEIYVNYLPERKFDVKVNVLDNRKMKEEFNWKPLVSIDEGLELTWDYVSDNLKKPNA